MLASAKSYDVICLQMRNYISHLESPMKRELNKLMSDVKSILATGKKVKPGIDSLLPIVFNFRIKAIKWLCEEEELDLSGIIEDIYPHFEELTKNSKLEVLAENILFALRCNKRIINAMTGIEGFSLENISTSAAKLPTITYEQFLASLAYGMPDDALAQKVINWINASLYIELITLATFIIKDEKLKISDKIINELAFIIADAAQQYSAIPYDIGIINHCTFQNHSNSDKIDNDFIKDQTFLADLGISDFAENF